MRSWRIRPIPLSNLTLLQPKRPLYRTTIDFILVFVSEIKQACRVACQCRCAKSGNSLTQDKRVLPVVSTSKMLNPTYENIPSLSSGSSLMHILPCHVIQEGPSPSPKILQRSISTTARIHQIGDRAPAAATDPISSCKPNCGCDEAFL